jgi:hypothetical protein
MRSLLSNTISKVTLVAALGLGLTSNAFAAEYKLKTIAAKNTPLNYNDPNIWQSRPDATSLIWNQNVVAAPGINDDVLIEANYQLFLTTPSACKKLTLNSPVSPNDLTYLDLKGYNFTANNDVTLGTNGTKYTTIILGTGNFNYGGNISYLGESYISTVIAGNGKPTAAVQTTGQTTPGGTKITPLPVELTSFTAVKKAGEVSLAWETASEKNNTGFEVQISLDGKNYEALTFVASKNGNATSSQRYAFAHKTAGKEGLVYYRLKQVDMDGKFEYFTAKVVDLGRATASVNTFPNPFQNQFELNLTAATAEKSQITVTDMTGKTVYAAEQNLTKGANTLKVELKNQPAGLYLLKATTGNQTYTNRLVKQ